MNRFLSLIIILISCDEVQTRSPINKNPMSFIKKSATKNKLRASREQFLMNISAKNDSLNIYKSSPKGFLYSIQNGNKNERLAKKGDFVKIIYAIEDLNNNILYSANEIGNVSFLVDQEDVMPALREGVKYLSEGDSGVFIFPSYLCFGYKGDFEKIGSNQPLRIKINLLTLSKIKK